MKNSKIKNKYKIIICLIWASFFTACSFNGMFLEPYKLTPGIPAINLVSDSDSTYIYFSGNNLQPTYTSCTGDTLNKDITIESFVFKSANGNNLNGWLIRPKNVKPQITLLHLHGNGGFILNQYKYMAAFAKYGIQSFVFDYSGFGFSDGDATRDNVLIDANSALSYLKSIPEVKNTKVVVYGQSLGGHLAAVLASQREADIDGLVVEGAFSSHCDIAAEKAGFFGRLLVKEKYSATESIANYHKPVMVIHSSEDKVIPFEMGRKIFDNANQPKYFYEVKHRHIQGPIFYSDSISHKIFEMLKIN